MAPLSCYGTVSESALVRAEGHNLSRGLSGLIRRPPSGNFSHGLLLLHNLEDQAPLRALRAPVVTLTLSSVTNHPLRPVLFYFTLQYGKARTKKYFFGVGFFVALYSPESRESYYSQGLPTEAPFYFNSRSAALQSQASVFCDSVSVPFRVRAKSFVAVLLRENAKILTIMRTTQR